MKFKQILWVVLSIYLGGHAGQTAANAASAQHVGKHVLTGEVDQTELSQFGLELAQRAKDSSHTEIVVKKVQIGSRADRWGILSGDIVIGMQTDRSGTIIEIERGGKIFAAQLSSERQLAATSSTSSTLKKLAAAREQVPFVGEYSGHIKQIKNIVRHDQYGLFSVADDGGDITTEFHISPEGLLVGTTSQYSGKSTMYDASKLSDHEYTFNNSNWQGDTFFSVYIFNDDFSSFMCYWAPVMVHMKHHPMYLNPSPTIDELKQIGFTEDGIRRN